MAENKQQNPGEILLVLMQEIIKKGEEFDPEGLVSGQEFVMDLISRISNPETREDKAMRALMELEVMDRSGEVPPNRRSEFLKMRQLAETRAGLRSPDDMHDFDNDPGTGWVRQGDEVMFIGDNDPSGKPHRYVYGSDEHKKRESEMNEKRKSSDSLLKEPSRLFDAYQKAYDERIENEKFAKLEAEQDRVAKWGRAGSKESELGTNRGMYPETPWTADQQAGMRDQGQPVDPKGMSKRRGPTGEEIGGRTLEEFQAGKPRDQPATLPSRKSVFGDRVWGALSGQTGAATDVSGKPVEPTGKKKFDWAQSLDDFWNKPRQATR